MSWFRKAEKPKSQPMLIARGVAKTFTLHAQGGAELAVLSGASLQVDSGEAVALSGPSGTGKTTFLRMLYGNYRATAGEILIHHQGQFVDIARDNPRLLLAVRAQTLGYVSQFLRVIPRVPAVDIVAEPLSRRGIDRTEAIARAESLLARLRIPERLWPLSPVTFSGGEQQRVNIARGFAADYPILLLDEPTASLDPANRDVVVALIGEAKARGVAVVGIFHDAAVREAVCDRVCDMAAFRATKDVRPSR